MFEDITRRRFVSSATQGSLAAGLGAFAFLNDLPSVSAEEARRPLAAVAPDVEPLVRLIEETPRDKVIDRVAEKIHSGTTYQELLTAVFMAGVRGIQPRPVGFKFHAVLVINSAHLASQASAEKDRWLPLLWSIDYFKSSQARNEREGNWRMAPVDVTKLPAEGKAKEQFIAAMENWDVEQADRAVTAFSRGGSATEVFEPFWYLGARDFRDIGHKAIFVANAWRALQAIGWRHREPVMRSLAYALLDHEGTNPAKRDDFRDRPGRTNFTRAQKMTNFREAGKRDDTATKDIITSLRKDSPEDTSRLTAELIEKGIHPGSIWDGLFLTAGELLMRQPGIVGLHCLTSINALHYASQTAMAPTTRAFTLLQTAAFLSLFRQTMKERGKMTDAQITTLEPVDGKVNLSDILADISKNRTQAARKTFTLLSKQPRELEPLVRATRRLIFAKGTDSHDYKFSSAVLEDAYALTPALRPAYMAASMFNLKGTGDKDNDLIKRAQAAMKRA